MSQLTEDELLGFESDEEHNGFISKEDEEFLLQDEEEITTKSDPKEANVSLKEPQQPEEPAEDLEDPDILKLQDDEDENDFAEFSNEDNSSTKSSKFTSEKSQQSLPETVQDSSDVSEEPTRSPVSDCGTPLIPKYNQGPLSRRYPTSQDTSPRKSMRFQQISRRGRNANNFNRVFLNPNFRGSVDVSNANVRLSGNRFTRPASQKEQLLFEPPPGIQEQLRFEPPPPLFEYPPQRFHSFQQDFSNQWGMPRDFNHVNQGPHFGNPGPLPSLMSTSRSPFFTRPPPSFLNAQNRGFCNSNNTFNHRNPNRDRSWNNHENQFRKSQNNFTSRQFTNSNECKSPLLTRNQSSSSAEKSQEKPTTTTAGVDADYLKKIEMQKQQREKIFQLKEQKRKLAMRKQEESQMELGAPEEKRFSTCQEAPGPIPVINACHTRNLSNLKPVRQMQNLAQISSCNVSSTSNNVPKSGPKLALGSSFLANRKIMFKTAASAAGLEAPIPNNTPSPPDSSDSSTSKGVPSSDFFGSRKIVSQNISLPQSAAVVVRNLAASTDEAKLLSFAQGIGQVKNILLDKGARQATIQFSNVNQAHNFYLKYQRSMLDLSIIQVSLE